MSDKIYIKNFIIGTIVGMILVTLIVWLIPENMYFDGEYPSWRQQKDYTHSKGDKPQILFLGDSAFKAAVVPDLISEDAYNLSLGGAGSIEMYYSLKNYMENHPKPKMVFISISAMHFIYLDRYRDRTLYFHFLSPTEQITSQLNIFKFDNIPFMDKIFISLENLQYMIKFPVKYFQTIKKSELSRGPLNEEIYQKAASERGHMLFGHDPEWFNHYEPHNQLLVDFKLLKSTDFYMKKLLQLCIDNDIPVYVVQTPINKMSYETTLKHNYFPPYQQYLQQLSQEFNVDIETDLKIYDIHLFGDHLHLNEEGAAIFSRDLKSKYKI
ncbi:MAG: hypothetical protein IJ563_12055 [Selenomonadaceae bacterium]|nr:hypothetical protein [Selenomonadaceae bacterium]